MLDDLNLSFETLKGPRFKSKRSNNFVMTKAPDSVIQLLDVVGNKLFHQTT